MYKSFLSLFLTLSVCFGQAPLPNDSLINTARTMIDQLCSGELAGRGYTHNGHLKASEYIADAFDKNPQIHPVDSPGFFQSFPITINLATEAKLTINGEEIPVGQDFIVNRFSGSGSTEGKIIDMDYGLNPGKEAEGNIVLIRNGWPRKLINNTKKREKYKNLSKLTDRIVAFLSYRPKAIIVVQDKLTAGFTRENAGIPILEIRADALPKRPKNCSLTVKSELSTVMSRNVLGMIPGARVKDSAIIISAHYDHLGQLEEAIFTGANDNASGVTMMLLMAEYYSKNPPDCSIIFIAFGGEETGLVGSRFYAVEDPLFPLEKTKFILNLDLMGNGIEGIVAVGGQDYTDQFIMLKTLNDELVQLPVVRSRKNAPNSDHFFFLQNGVPGFFIYTLGGPPHYHDVNDTPQNLELSKFLEVMTLMIAFVDSLM